MWDYSVTDKQAELKAIQWDVYNSNQYKTLIIETKNGDRVLKSDMPLAYKERIGIEGRASLVIENITFQDNTFFRCTLRAEPASGLQSRVSSVKLIVTGMTVWNCYFLIPFGIVVVMAQRWASGDGLCGE